MIPDNVTKNETLEVFEECLSNAATEGLWCMVGVGLDAGTMQAINNVAKAHPNASEELIQKAKKAFQKAEK